MVVIGVGLSRTGTLSTRAALELLLRGPCYHGFVPVGDRPDHILLWLEMFQSGELEPDMTQRPLEGYRVGLDLTIYTFYKWLMKVHPTAKVLLTVREPHKWFASMKNFREITHMLALRQPYAFLLRMMGLGLLLDFLSGIQAPQCLVCWAR